MERTSTYTYFSIVSNGDIKERGLVGSERGIFNPDDITNLLGVEPFRCRKKGDLRRNGTEYLYSSWSAEKSSKERLDIESQCLETISRLKGKIEALNEIKKLYDVNFCIMVVPYIVREEKPIMSFNSEVIEFCYKVGATIEVDLYIYS